MARMGSARFGEPHPELCALGVYPHHDRLMLGIGTDVAEKYGIASFEDLREKKPPLKLVAATRDGVARTRQRGHFEGRLRRGSAGLDVRRPHKQTRFRDNALRERALRRPAADDLDVLRLADRDAREDAQTRRSDHDAFGYPPARDRFRRALQGDRRTVQGARRYLAGSTIAARRRA
jgi:hypothetical protein